MVAASKKPKGKKAMKHFLSILAVLFAASAFAAEPKPYLTIDASGQAVVKSGLPVGTKVNYQIIHPGTQDALLCIYWPEGDRARLAIFNFAFVPYGEPQPQPNPEPQPTPEPPPVPPDPVPPPPVEKTWGLVVVYESKSMAPDQGKVITSKKIDDLLSSKKWHRANYDQDAVDENDKQISTIKAYRARAKTLPWYFVVGEAGEIQAEGSLPSESNLRGILEKIGGKK